MSFEYKQPFDGTQPEVPIAEQEYVASTFASFVDDTLLNHIDKIQPMDRGESMLALTGEQDDLQIKAYVFDAPQGLDYVKAINLLEIDENGRGGNRLSYRLGTDGIVRRVDIDKRTPDQRKADRGLEQKISHSPTEVDMSAVVLESVKRATEGLENFKLETRLGVNNQPVGSAEIERVIEFTKSAKPEA